MAKGSSGRIVIEIVPEIKHELYEALDKEGLTLKQWFLTNAEVFLKNRGQMSLLPVEDGHVGKNHTVKAK
ncbi:hypothetical protein MNBD_GAMMA11-3451 [hydrothermal vent metagenome]|uniref:Uncharacterized protein n=1 Tax=hydrothermal vent metagenome TaxID=652676 RepID=A0A3B0XRK1_9ZZZZ